MQKPVKKHKPKMAIEAKQTPCSQYACALEETFAFLEKLTAELTEKLTPVLNPKIGVITQATEKEPEPPIAPFAQYLKQRNEQGQQIARKLASLIGELEC